MRKIKLTQGEFYHVLNRGVDKRNIFLNWEDIERFFRCMTVFNSTELTGSLYEQSFQKEKSKAKPLVRFIAYNLLGNHFHFILEQTTEDGISKFMKRLQGGYSWYFNNKYKRSGSLFQGPFRPTHIDSNEYLLHSSVYVNLNHKITALGDRVAKFEKSSWEEYITNKKLLNFCTRKDLVWEQFRSKEDYKEFALSTLEDIKLNKEKLKELEG